MLPVYALECNANIYIWWNVNVKCCQCIYICKYIYMYMMKCKCKMLAVYAFHNSTSILLCNAGAKFKLCGEQIQIL